jgi:hypothetical protein
MRLAFRCVRLLAVDAALAGVCPKCNNMYGIEIVQAAASRCGFA